MEAFEAARILYRSGDERCGLLLLRRLWEDPRRQAREEFRLFCALVEIWARTEPGEVLGFLDSVLAGCGETQVFLSRRSLAEQGVLFDWHGQLALHEGDKATGFESLSRAATLGRDTSLLWRQLGEIYVDNEELELGLRYLQRSLQLFREPDLDLLSGRDEPLGAFTGEHPLKVSHNLEDFLALLLRVTRIAQGQRNLRAVRELVCEMIHQFPDENRLPKIRLLIERTIVNASLSQVDGATAKRLERPTPPLPVRPL